MMSLISTTGYMVIAIAIIVGLVAIFFVSFVFYKKTPEPKGSIFNKGEMCKSCKDHSCSMYKDSVEEEKEDE